MEIRFEAFDASDVDRLVAWLPAQDWQYHATPRVDEAWVRERASSGYFFGAKSKSFLLFARDSTLIGLVRAFDLADLTPLVDLRIGDSWRGQGAGTVALRWLTRHVFESSPETQRLGGYTR